jgi:hypothetical protein
VEKRQAQYLSLAAGTDLWQYDCTHLCLMMLSVASDGRVIGKDEDRTEFALRD